MVIVVQPITDDISIAWNVCLQRISILKQNTVVSENYRGRPLFDRKNKDSDQEQFQEMETKRPNVI